MEKISVSNIVEFRRKSPNSQITFIHNLRKPKVKNESEEGGNYWVHSLSTIGNVYRSEDEDLIQDKIEILREKHIDASANISKNMFQRNISILKSFEDYKFSKIKPKYKLTFLSKPKEKSILKIKGLPVQVLPHHVYTYTVSGTEKISAVWFVSKLDGYKTEELAIFTDALYRYLKLNYSKEYEIDPDFCISVDVMNLASLSYSQLIKRELPQLLNSTLDTINKIV